VKDSNSFLRDLSTSRVAVNEFAQRMRGKGLQVWLPPESVRPDASVRRDYADDGDLMVQGRVEHKVRTTLDFTCRDDFPYDTVIVDEVYKEDAKSDSLLICYVFENANRTHAAVVYGWTRKAWLVERRPDSIQGRDCDFYTVPKSMVRFCSVDEVF
jgi:hypothetical protein